MCVCTGAHAFIDPDPPPCPKVPEGGPIGGMPQQPACMQQLLSCFNPASIKHPRSSKDISPVYTSAMAPCLPAHAFTMPQTSNRVCDGAGQQAHHQQTEASHAKLPGTTLNGTTAPVFLTAGSGHAPCKAMCNPVGLSRPTSNSLQAAYAASCNNSFAHGLQFSAPCLPRSANGVTPDHDSLDFFVPQLRQSLRARSALAHRPDLDDYVPISSWHRQAWDASHGSLQSFKQLCQRMRRNKRKTWSIAPAFSVGPQMLRSSASKKSRHNTEKPIPSSSECICSDLQQAHAIQPQHGVLNLAQQVICSYCMLPVPAKSRLVIYNQSTHSSLCLPQQPLPWSPPTPLQSAQHSPPIPQLHSSNNASQQSLPSSLAHYQPAPLHSCSPTRHALQPIWDAGATAADLKVPGRVYKPQCDLEDFGFETKTSIASTHAAHEQQSQELQHSMLEWIVANFAGSDVTCTR